MSWLELSPKVCGTALTGAALFAAVWVLATVPRPQPFRLGVRGLRRQRALRASAVWTAVEPIVRWLGERCRGWVPSGWRRPIDRYLAQCGDPLGLSADELVALSTLSFATGLGAGLELGPTTGMGPTLALLVAPLAAAGPYLAIAHVGSARLTRIRRAWPHFLELLALAVGAGSDFPGGVRQVVDRSVDPSGDLMIELSHLLRELQLGFTRRQALQRLSERVPLDSVAEFVSSVVQAEERGTPLAHVLRTQADAARARRTVCGEEAASRAGVKMVAPLFLVFLCILLLVLGPPLLALSDQTPGASW